MSTFITDVPGIRIGHAQRLGAGWLTGVTVVLPPAGTVGSVDVRGGGPGTHETDALDPTTLVATVDAVCLTGGSAFGLAASAGVQRWCEEQGRGFAVPGGVVPIVPAAAIFDLGRGGNFEARPDAGMGYAATSAAGGSEEFAAVARGNVGAGTGAAISRGRYKGGVGTVSIALDGANAGIIVGALAVVNAVGAPLFRARAENAGQPQSGGRAADAASGIEAQDLAGESPQLNTTLVVVATNAVLDPAQCKRTATAAHAGLARALTPVHTLTDGDTVFALATGAQRLAGEGAQFIQSVVQAQAAAAAAVEVAVRDAVEQAEAVNNGVVNLPRWTAAGSLP